MRDDVGETLDLVVRAPQIARADGDRLLEVVVERLEAVARGRQRAHISHDEEEPRRSPPRAAGRPEAIEDAVKYRRPCAFAWSCARITTGSPRPSWPRPAARASARQIPERFRRCGNPRAPSGSGPRDARDHRRSRASPGGRFVCSIVSPLDVPPLGAHCPAVRARNCADFVRQHEASASSKIRRNVGSASSRYPRRAASRRSIWRRSRSM